MISKYLLPPPSVWSLICSSRIQTPNALPGRPYTHCSGLLRAATVNGIENYALEKTKKTAQNRINWSTYPSYNGHSSCSSALTLSKARTILPTVSFSGVAIGEKTHNVKPG